jgi:hypothetical protein
MQQDDQSQATANLVIHNVLRGACHSNGVLLVRGMDTFPVCGRFGLPRGKTI